MFRSKNALDALLKTADLAARVVPAERLFSWSNRSFMPPDGWVALACRPDQDPALVRAGESCERGEITEVLFVRSTPVECRFSRTDVPSADGHECCGTLRLAVRIMPEPVELAAFRKNVMGASESLSAADVQRYLNWPAMQLLTHLAGALPTATLLQPIESVQLTPLVQRHFGAACLAGGLIIEPAATVEFTCDAYLAERRRQKALEQQHQEASARTQIQQALAAAQSQRLGHLIGMLEQMREASRQHGERTMTDLLQAFEPVERGQLYSALWQLVPSRRHTRWIAVVSGYELLLYDPADMARPDRRFRLPKTLGALRSVSADAGSIADGLALVGAATGVHLIEIETGEVRESLAAVPAGTASVRGGFNAAGMSERHVLASHSELGIISWPRSGDPGRQPTALLDNRDATRKTVRCLRVAGEHAWVAIDEMVWRLSPDSTDDVPVSYEGSRAPISAVTLAGASLYAGNAEGEIRRWDLASPSEQTVLRQATGTPVESVQVIDTGGVQWLVAPDGRQALSAAVIGDYHACRYDAGTQRIRRAAVAEDLFAATNDTRDRLIAWRPQEPASPVATVVIPYLTGSTIQDVALIAG